MIKGQVISGEFGKILIRQKADSGVEIGELVVSENAGVKILMQVVDLLYGSQISQQNLELISGMRLEENVHSTFFDEKLRNYYMAKLKSMLMITENKSVVCKNLPKFFSSVRGVSVSDLSFLTKPKSPLFLGKLRSGSKVLDVDIFLEGSKVLCHHILIPAATGRGKSLDENEEVLIKTKNSFLIKPIGELVNNYSNFEGSDVLSMNPKNYSTGFKKIIKFVKHKAPRFMYNITTESGREIMVTKDHNLYILRKGALSLLKTEDIKNTDNIPLPLKIETSGNMKELNIYEILKENEKIYVIINKDIIKKLKSKKDCIKILAKYHSRPWQKYKDFINGKIRLTLFKKLLHTDLSLKDLKSLELTDQHKSIILKALFPLNKEFLQLMGYYIAEGYCLNGNSFRISCSDLTVQNHVSEILKKIGLHYFMIKKDNKNVDIGISSSIFTKILKKIGVGSLSGNKRLPNFFMGLSNNNLRTMLQTYYEGDGGVDKLVKKENRNIKITCTTKSKKLASDICIALLKFEILGRCKKTWKRATNTNHIGNWYYRISISGKSNLKRFLEDVGFQFEGKNNILKGKFNYKENTNVDVIPVNINDFKIRRIKTNLSQTQFANKLHYSHQIISLIESGKRRPSRELFSLILSKFHEFSDLSHLINFRWDKIKEVKKIRYKKKYVYDLTIKDNKTFFSGHGGLFVHNSNLTSCMLWDLIDKDYCGVLVLDPHDEYYGRVGNGLKNHPNSSKVSYYSPYNVPPGQKTLKINISLLKPSHFNGVINFSDPQRQALYMFYKKFGNSWIEAIILEKPLDVQFYAETISVVKRRLISVLDLDIVNNQLFCNGIFDLNAGDGFVEGVCNELESGKVVIIDTSHFTGSLELLIGSLLVSEVFSKYKRYKADGLLREKPVISVVLEEAPRVLGKEILEKGSNIFSTIAREGRKFKVGLVAITQLPSLIPREILANMNTKIILGIEMQPERQAIIDSAAQDLTDDSRAIASLDVGEAIVTSNFSRFATPIKIPFFDELVKKKGGKEYQKSFSEMG